MKLIYVISSFDSKGGCSIGGANQLSRVHWELGIEVEICSQNAVQIRVYVEAVGERVAG